MEIDLDILQDAGNLLITIVLFESALELIPEHLRKHSQVKKEWRINTQTKQQGILFDGANHRSLLQQVELKEKRGRPDIIHHCLMNICYSPLFKKGSLKVTIHTINNHYVNIPANWRVPVNYNRFCGLFAQLLLKKRVPLTGKPILILQKGTVTQILQSHEQSNIYLFESPKETDETLITVNSLAEVSLSSSTVFLIGGFQSGIPQHDFRRTKEQGCDLQLLTIYDEVKPAWVICGKLISWLEDIL